MPPNEARAAATTHGSCSAELKHLRVGAKAGNDVANPVCNRRAHRAEALYAPRLIRATAVKKQATPNWKPVDRPGTWPKGWRVGGAPGGEEAAGGSLAGRAARTRDEEWYADKTKYRQHAEAREGDKHDEAVLERLSRGVGDGHRQG
eukprot:scaffold10325_cov123-Isochrysis_galbana.AAC.7